MTTRAGRPTPPSRSPRSSRRLPLLGLSAALALLLTGAGTGCTATPHYAPPQDRTFHVGADGDDGNDGRSPDTAWRTLARAEREGLRPGDRLLLEGGARFPGTVTLGEGEAGSADRPVEIGSYGEGRARIVAADGPAVSVHNTAGVTIRDLDLTGGQGAYRRDGGINLYADRPGTGTLDRVTVSGVDVSGFRIGLAVGSAAPGTGFKDVTVRETRLHGNKDAGLLTYGPDFDAKRPAYAHENVTLERVEADRNTGDPEEDRTHSGSGIILGGVQGAVVRDSTAHDNGARGNERSPAGPVGIWAYDATRVLFEHNTAYRNHTGSDVDGAGFGIDSNVSASTLQYNLAFHNDGPGFYVFTRYRNGAHTDNTLRWNMSAHDGRKLPLKGGIAVLGVDINKLRVYQNTVLMTATEHEQGPALRLQDDEKDITVRNNNLITDGSPLVFVEKELDAPNVLLQGNNYRAPQGQWTVTWAGRTYTGLAEWRAATGQEQLDGEPTGRTLDPCLSGGELPEVDEPSDARRLVPDCPNLAGKGLDLRERFGLDPGAEDYFGRTVPDPPPIGAAQPRT
ncbi:right-handed parallel beta-helix repeat-containing protein [Streptomyces sp. Da 82-17]|uniref:right-handed parallel beta-helix repeat-containing protein n=1 Tax=Streptomyces sp. Da 82-17 TaxID=3377116 RepID=UPI0038D4E88B